MAAFQPAEDPAPPPEVPFVDGDGMTRTLADFKGNGVVLNFWATWCVPCVAEMPALDAFYKENRGRGFELLAVNMGQDAATVGNARRRVEVSFPMLADPLKIATQRYGVIGAPTSFIVDGDGVVVERIDGPLSARDLQRKIGGLL